MSLVKRSFEEAELRNSDNPKFNQTEPARRGFGGHSCQIYNYPQKTLKNKTIYCEKNGSLDKKGSTESPVATKNLAIPHIYQSPYQAQKLPFRPKANEKMFNESLNTKNCEQSNCRHTVDANQTLCKKQSQASRKLARFYQNYLNNTETIWKGLKNKRMRARKRKGQKELDDLWNWMVRQIRAKWQTKNYIFQFYLQHRKTMLEDVIRKKLTPKDIKFDDHELWIDAKNHCVFLGPNRKPTANFEASRKVPLTLFLTNLLKNSQSLLMKHFPALHDKTKKFNRSQINLNKKGKEKKRKSKNKINNEKKIKKRKPANKKGRDEEGEGCNCTRNRCLQLHCKCFQNNKRCGKHCNCKGCFNSEKNQKTIDKIKKETKKLCEYAFEKQVLTVEINGENKHFSKGCLCKKFGCEKNYCGCFKNGLGCNPLCQCKNCNNSKCNLEPEDARKLYIESRKFQRKKNKKVLLKTFINT